MANKYLGEFWDGESWAYGRPRGNEYGLAEYGLSEWVAEVAWYGHWPFVADGKVFIDPSYPADINSRMLDYLRDYHDSVKLYLLLEAGWEPQLSGEAPIQEFNGKPLPHPMLAMMGWDGNGDGDEITF